jgi:hypothetical protein
MIVVCIKEVNYGRSGDPTLFNININDILDVYEKSNYEYNEYYFFHKNSTEYALPKERFIRLREYNLNKLNIC